MGLCAWRSLGGGCVEWPHSILIVNGICVVKFFSVGFWTLTHIYATHKHPSIEKRWHRKRKCARVAFRMNDDAVRYLLNVSTNHPTLSTVFVVHPSTYPFTHPSVRPSVRSTVRSFVSFRPSVRPFLKLIHIHPQSFIQIRTRHLINAFCI